jgi:hypothetical protein
VNPLIICLRRNIVIINTGVSATVNAAHIGPHLIPSEPRNIRIEGAIVLAVSVVKIRAYRNSFHEKMKQRRKVTSKAGKAKGRVIFRNTVMGEPPSTRAASSSSFGIDLKNPYSSHTARGALYAK